MLVHISALCSPVTAHGTFGTQSGHFLTSPHVSQKVAHSLFAGASHFVTNWDRPVSCADFEERQKILLAIGNYHKDTDIRFRLYDPSTDLDYIYITGEDSGCWSYVGRIGGVSNGVQGVAKTSPALSTASLAFGSLSRVTNPPPSKIPFWVNHEPSCPICRKSARNQPSSPKTKCGTLTATWIFSSANIFFVQCHHMSLWTSWSSILGMAVV